MQEDRADKFFPIPVTTTTKIPGHYIQHKRTKTLKGGEMADQLGTSGPEEARSGELPKFLFNHMSQTWS